MLKAEQFTNGNIVGTPIARPLIAKAQVELFLPGRGGCGQDDSRGNDQVRLELAQTLAPDLKVIAPREWDIRSGRTR